MTQATGLKRGTVVYIGQVDRVQCCPICLKRRGVSCADSQGWPVLSGALLKVRFVTGWDMSYLNAQKSGRLSVVQRPLVSQEHRFIFGTGSNQLLGCAIT